MTDKLPANQDEIFSAETLSLLEKSIFGVKKTVAGPSVSAVGEANIVERISLIMPTLVNYMRHIPSPPTGKGTPLATCLLLYDRPSPTEETSPTIDDIIKILSQGVGAFRWHHGPRLTKLDRAIANQTLRDHLLTQAAGGDPNAYAPNSPTEQESAISTSLLDIKHIESRSNSPAIDKASNEEANSEESVTSPSNLHSNIVDETEDESLRDQPVLDEVSSLESLTTRMSIREAQYEAARAVIPVLRRNRNEQEAHVATARNLLKDIESNPLPTSTDGLHLGQIIEIIGKRRERQHIAERLEEQENALNRERSAALERLHPFVTRAGEWLEANGPKPRQLSPSAGNQVNVEEDSDAGDDRRSKTPQLPEQNDRSEESEEQPGIDGKEDVDAKQESSSANDSDFEDQLRQLQQDDAEDQVGGRASDVFDEQTSLR